MCLGTPGRSPPSRLARTGVGRVYAYERAAMVTIVPAPGGVLAPSGTIVRPLGQPFNVGVQPNPGWRIGTVAGCGGTLNGSTFQISSVQDDCTITATADSGNAVKECNEKNNQRSETTPG